MDKNEIKKSLYKEKPIAYFGIDSAEAKRYYCELGDGTVVNFIVPYSDMGTSKHRFKDEMTAHELIRWMQNEN